MFDVTYKHPALTLIDELHNCPPGRAEAATYEKIGTEIMYTLFGEEFAEFLVQSPTNDGMYKMDLQCALKGSTPFWKYLKRKFNSDFLVVEFKNYSCPLRQTPVITTQKYLCSHAFRNVAFIISRKGLSPHAKQLVSGYLRSNQLLIELNDSDLVEMLRMKANKEDPSDYLLHKVYRLLMGVSA